MISRISPSSFDPRCESPGRMEFLSGNGAQTAAAENRQCPLDVRDAVWRAGAIRGGGHARRASFSTVAAGGRYIVRPYELGGWFVQSVTLGGKDITDRAFDLQADTTSLVVTYTDRPRRCPGTVTDARGDASPTAVVLAFPVDPQPLVGLRRVAAQPEKRVDVANRRLHVRPPAARRLLRDRGRSPPRPTAGRIRSARGARERGGEADGRRERYAEDARSSREGDPMIAAVTPSSRSRSRAAPPRRRSSRRATRRASGPAPRRSPARSSWTGRRSSRRAACV